MGTHNMSNTFDKLSVLDSFIEEVNSYLPEIETNLERLAQSPADMDALEETYRRTHTIGGSASMMDFPGLAHVSHGMEDILGDALDSLITLDAPSLGLLRRSLGRLHQLLEGIRNGIDEEAVIAEDDADYAQYRAQIESAATPSIAQEYLESPQLSNNDYTQAAPPSPSLESSFGISTPYAASPALPSFDEVLASFRTPSGNQGEDMGWPEEPALVSRFDEAVAQGNTSYAEPEQVEPVQPAVPQPEEPEQRTHTSALDALVASTRRFASATAPAQQEQVPDVSVAPSLPVPSPQPPKEKEQTAPPLHQYAAPYENTTNHAYAQPEESEGFASVPVVPDQHLVVQTESLPQAYTAMQQEVQSLDVQVSSFRDVVSQLQDAMTVIEGQRSEFKGFLNGSKDALDRMEDWAGKAMGLNLRNSPEQVRRYLPLSVMWVSNTKLKRVLDLLRGITEGIETNDSQLDLVVKHLQSSLGEYGTLFQELQARAQGFSQDPGWGPWEMQVSRHQSGLRQRVTFEREGDPAVLRSEIEAQVREELRQEYEVQNAASATRLELERQIREEVRREFAERERFQIQAALASTGNSGDIQALESRLRNEIEIQVRQEFLSQIMNDGDDPSAMANQLMSNLRTNVSTPTGQQDGSSATTIVSQNDVNSAQSAPAVMPLVSATTSSGNNIQMDIDEEAAEIFRLEAEELLQAISMHVAALEKNPTNRDLIQGIRRATHTLKGAAGMMGFRTISDLAHVSEDLLDLIMEGTVSISTMVVSLILDTAEALDLLIMGNDQVTGEARARELHVRYVEFLGERSSAAQFIEDDLDEDEDLSSGPGMTMGNSMSSVVENDNSTATNVANAARGGHGNLSVHVRLQKLDELVNLFGEMLVSRSVLEERLNRLNRLVADVTVSSNRLGDVGQKLESRFEAATLPSGKPVQVMPGEGDQSLLRLGAPLKDQAASVPAHLSEFDELELDRYTEFHQLARGLSEGISDMATLSTEMDAIIRESEGIFARESRLSTTFQDRLMKVRLVPLASMAPRLYRAARAVALKQGKEVNFVLEGEETEVDRTVYEEVFGPLLHLVRNAVNHAIEIPSVRRQRGKNTTGIVKITAAYEGNQIVIAVRDDGSGLDREHIRQTAITRGLIRSDQMIGEDEVVSLIFRPGFSTAAVLSEESGRGVGLDVVRDSVSRLRGSLVVESTPGQGTAFTMTFPTSLAIQSAMMVQVGTQQFAIPTANVESIGRLDNFKRTTSGGQPAVIVRNEPYPLYMLAQYLSLPVNTALDDKAQILLVNTGGHRVALIVDEIRGKFDIVMKNLGPHLREVHGIAGGTVLGNGQVVLVLELLSLLSTNINLISAFGRRDAAAQAQVRQRIDVSSNNRQNSPVRPTATASPAAERGKYLLVVDDSPSVRRVVSNMLKQNGWTVQMARDGVEALEMISNETPSAVLLDIEMPRMDGYELISTVRAQEQYRTLPLIVLTSRAASKHQQRAMTLGASAYVIKPYQDEELLSTINSLVYGAGNSYR
jgi:chemotaxis protein histidine kinase CheA/ActR/RegA family two-component response regulator